MGKILSFISSFFQKKESAKNITIKNAQTLNTNSTIINVDKTPIFSQKQILENCGNVLGVNTKIGFFHIESNKSQNNAYGYLKDIIFYDTSWKRKVIIQKVETWRFKYPYLDSVLIFTCIETEKTYLIDSTGTIYHIPNVTYRKFSCPSLINNKRNGTIDINGVTMKYRTEEQTIKFQNDTNAITNQKINPEFTKFFNQRKRLSYMWFTVRNNKCGSILRYCMAHGMKYETVPNVFEDDETVNIRIPLSKNNLLREDVQYIHAKYLGSADNTYCIFDVPYFYVSDMAGKTIFYHCPQKYENLALSVLNAIRNAFNVDNDTVAILYVTEPIFNTVGKVSNNYNNYVDNYWKKELLYKSYNISLRYICDNIQYINSLTEHPINEYMIEYYMNHYNTINDLPENERKDIYKRYSEAYDKSKSLRMNAIKEYESNLLVRMHDEGYKITKWTNESNLYFMVKKEYPDALYQYSDTWLGNQSIDIYIPSLNIGIEYQGIQHFQPVEIFGGVEGFKKTVERDKRKAILCKNNNVILLYWKYDESIRKDKLMAMINDCLHNAIK